MQCPVDQATLLMTERRGVEIDYCPECRGVWLDRGELDKLLAGESAHSGDEDRGERRRSPDAQRSEAPTPKKKKKKKTSFLSDIFESIGGEG